MSGNLCQGADQGLGALRIEKRLLLYQQMHQGRILPEKLIKA